MPTFKGFRIALGFLTILPFPAKQPFEENALAKALPWFTWVGLLLGLIVAGAGVLLGRWFSPFTAAVLTIIVWVLLSGGLHLDGLADCFDGLMVSASRERRLEIMKDPRLGTFAAIGLALYLLLKTAFVQEMIVEQTWIGLVFAATAGRAAVLLTVRQPSARPGGLGDQVSRGASWPGLIFGLLPVLGSAVFEGLRGLLGMVFAGLMTMGIIRLAKRRIGGVTGDVHGFAIEMSELAVLMAYQIPFLINLS